MCTGLFTSLKPIGTTAADHLLWSLAGLCQAALLAVNAASRTVAKQITPHMVNPTTGARCGELNRAIAVTDRAG
jgi:hypothetical protein